MAVPVPPGHNVFAAAAAAAAGPPAEKSIYDVLHKVNGYLPYIPIVAIDCEMVATNVSDMLVVKIVVVERDGRTKLDIFAQLPAGEVITDYKTPFTNYKPGELERELARAPSHADAMRMTREALAGCTVVGHGIYSDLDALGIPYENPLDREVPPEQLVTSPPFPLPLLQPTVFPNPGCFIDTGLLEGFYDKDGMIHVRYAVNINRQYINTHRASKEYHIKVIKRRGLRDLVGKELNVAIQGGHHDPAEDAVASLALYGHWRMTHPPLPPAHGFFGFDGFGGPPSAGGDFGAFGSGGGGFGTYGFSGGGFGGPPSAHGGFGGPFPAGGGFGTHGFGGPPPVGGGFGGPPSAHGGFGGPPPVGGGFGGPPPVGGGFGGGGGYRRRSYKKRIHSSRSKRRRATRNYTYR